jgi:hypothetical protein
MNSQNIQDVPVPQELVLNDVYDVWLTSFWHTPLGYALIGFSILTALALLYLFFRLIQARRGTTKEQSLRALRALAEKSKKGSIETKKVYQELTGAIKLYSQWRYGLPRGMTDYELTSLLAEAGCEKMQQAHVCRIMTEAQIVKFGRIEALRSQVQQDIATVITFIEETAHGKQ